MKQKLLQAMFAVLLCVNANAQVNSGSNGSDGAFNPTTNTVINMADHPNGIYQYTSVNVPTNVTVTFIPNANNTPVYWLVQNNVVINGTVDVHAQHGPTGGGSYPSNPCFTNGGVGGPGGGLGGNGGSSPTPGQGPGGGGVPAGGGGFGTQGIGFWGAGQGGQVYGNPTLIPLVGGSGGGGGGGFSSGGGGGSGSILIGASGSIDLNGVIDASGSLGFYSGGGSGGGVRLVTSSFFGSGAIRTKGTDPLGYDGGGDGRVRIDALANTFNGQITGALSQGSPITALTVVQTNRTPTTAESTPAFLLSPPPSSQLEIFAVSGFTTTPPFPLDKNRMTVVMTHGWNSDPNGWATNMAALMIANLGAGSPNIVAWDWRGTAKADLPGTPAAQTHDQGIALGQALANALGPNYSKQIHFIGHSLGTLVNANAADYLHANGFAWTNTQITLFDEAEAATGITSFGAAIETLIGKNGNPFYPKEYYDHPLPKQFRWADNYVAAFGLLHPEAANVILTNNFPANAPTVSGWFGALTTFHGYPMPWYDETIQTDVSALGFRWSFERGGWFSQAPATNSVYVQATSEWNLTPTNWAYGTNLLNARYQAYRNSLAYAITGETPNSASVNGYGSGQNIVGALPAFNSFIFSLLTTPANNSQAPQLKVHPLGLTPNDASSNTNIPAYAWMPLAVPANAVSMSFDYKIQGDWQSDLLAAAFNGTNILSVPGSQIETNVLFSSGALDVSAFAGQTNEFFIGIVGGTSTNAQVTVQNLAFSISSPPLLQAQASGNNCVLSWPLSAANYVLQTSTNLTDTNSWMAVPNVPAIVNLQNAVTNSAFDRARFYRLRK